jgi:predicted DNA repair protein MutK
VEKVLHSLQHKKAKTKEAAEAEFTAIETDLAKFEKDKVKGAIRTDFILSAEIVVISLGTVATAAFGTKVLVLSVIAILMTVGVYGFVAMIVKIDDLGLYLTKQTSHLKQSIGNGLLAFAPKLMKTLTIVGTIAMFLVGGGIITHAIPQLHHFTEDSVDQIQHIPTVGNIIGSLTPTLINLAIGFVAGLLVFVVITTIQKFWPKSKQA